MRSINLILAIIALVAAIVLSTIGSGAMRNSKGAFLSLTGPFVRLIAAAEGVIGGTEKEKKSPEQLAAENEQLSGANKQLLTENQLLRDLEQENKKLREALDYRDNKDIGFKLLPARIISRDASAWWNTVKIDRGFEDGVDKDMTVLTESGLVGKTTTVAKNESIVLLITDENCKVAVRIEGTQEKGIACGLRVQSAEAPKIQLNFLTKSAALQEGQKVFTAGVGGGVFPSNIKLGDIQSFRVRELDTQAIVTPAVDIPKVENVFIVVGAK